VLPAGWYPSTSKSVIQQFEQWDTEYEVNESSTGVIVPHAGWYYSGKLAYAGIKSLDKECDVVCILGGHLLKGNSLRVVIDDAIETPLGNLELDRDILTLLKEQFDFLPDDVQDNTIEIHLPIVKYFFPNRKIVPVRVPPDSNAVKLGNILASIEKNEGKKIGIIGSTDLTHYGPAYNFTPKGTGKDAELWVKNSNDKEIVKAMCSLDTDNLIKLGNTNHAACSVGAAAAVVEFSREKGITEGKVIQYFTSADIQAGKSFVGYVAVTYG